MSTSRIAVVVGDIHLDASPNGRLDEAERVCAAIAADVADTASVIVIAGDLFQHTRSNAVERNAAVRVVRRFAAVAPVVILRGNHDGLGELDYLRHLRAPHPVIVEDGYAVHVVAGIAIACAAWPCKASLLARVNTTSARAADQALLTAFRAEMDRLAGELDKHTGPKMLVAHAMVRGATTSPGQPLVGCELEVSLDDLALARAPITVLGHIHKAQAWRGTGQAANDWKSHDFECEGLDGAVIYTGSPRPTDFGDLDDKSYLRVHFDECDDGRVRPVGWDRIPTTATPLRVALATWDGTTLALAGEPTDHTGAEVQLRYAFPAADTPRVAPQAAAHRAAIEAAGAVKVHLAPRKIATVEARAPQVSEARTLVDKVRAYWDLHGTPAHPERKLARLDDLNLATAIPKPRPGWMRFRSVAFSGIRPFDGEVAIDLDELDGRVIALTGEPGAGKSTLLEAFTAHFPGRTLRTHGKVKDLMAADPGAFLSATFDSAAGEGLTVRQTFGRGAARTPRVEILTAEGAALKDQDGKEVLPKCGADEYDVWARANLPHASSYFASTFIAQDKQAWLDLDTSPRKGVLLRVAGVEYVEGLAKVAGERERGARGVLATLSGKCDELRRALGLPELYGDPKTPRTGTVLCQSAEERRVVADMAVRGATADVVVAENTLVIANTCERLRARRSAIAAQAEEKLEALRDLDGRICDLWHKKGEVSAIARAERERERLGWQIDGLDGAIKMFEKDLAALDILRTEAITLGHSLQKQRGAENDRRAERRRAIDRRRAEVRAERLAAEQAVAARQAILSQAAEIRSAAADMERLTGEMKAAKQAIDRAIEEEREAALPLPALHEAAREAQQRAGAAAAIASDRAGWPALVRAHLEKKAEHACFLAAIATLRANTAAQLDAVQHIHEHRARDLRTAVDAIAGGDVVDGAQELAQETAAADDARLKAAAGTNGTVEQLKAELARLDAELAAAHRADAAERLPDSIPADEQAVLAAIAQAEAAHVEASIACVGSAVRLADGERLLTAAQARRAAADATWETLRAARVLAEGIASKAPQLDGAEERVAELTAALAKTGAEDAALADEHATLAAEIGPTQEEQATARRKAALTDEREQTLGALSNASTKRAFVLIDIATQDRELAKRDAVAAAGALLVELEAQRAALAAEEAALRAALAADLVPLDSVPTVESARAALDAAQTALATERERQAVVATHLAALAEREAEREGALADVEDWEHWAFVLGRNGIQADEVDAIGPRIAALATMFLHECFGTEWTVTEIDTVGSCDAMIAVADEPGDPRSDRTFSPGQRAILSGVLSLAISTIEAQNAGVTGTTLFFDEPSGPLSVEKAVAWVRMIRKAIDIVGADKALFISHTPEAVKEADVRIVVAGGRAVVE